VFEGPADAVRCAFVSARRVQELGLEIRGGVHFGEIETSGSDVHGIVVHTGARVMGQAGAAEVLVTQTVRDLVAGARIEIAERGAFDLKGVPGTWTLFDVVGVDDEVRPPPVAPEEAVARRDRASQARSTGRPQRRRAVVGIAGVLVLALVAGVTVALLRRPSTYVPAAGTVARIDGDRFQRPVPVGSFPLAITEGEGRVWVMDRASQAYWVNEADGSIGSLGTEGTPTGAAAGGGSVWITNGFGAAGAAGTSVGRLDPATGRLSSSFETPIGSEGIAYGGGAVWVSNHDTGTVTRYEAVSGSTTTIPLPQSDGPAHPDPIAFGSVGGEAAWVGDALSNRIFRIQAVAPYQVLTFTVGGPPSAVAVGPDAIWVASSQADAIYSLDPATGALRTVIDIGSRGCNAPTSLGVNAEGVWVACALSQQVMRFDPSGARAPESLPVGGTAEALTIAEDGSVWVAIRPR
jgi:streptogramin lyase